MLSFLSKKSKIKLKVLAWYQIIGGIAGLLVTFWLIARIEQVNGLMIFLVLFALALYIFSIYCGRLLLTNNYQRGLKLTLINQALQIFQFAMMGYAFWYVAGLMFTIGIKYVDELTFNFNFALTSTWQMSIATKEHEFLLAINLVAIYLTYFTANLRNIIKQEEIAYEEEPTPEPLPPFNESDQLPEQF